MNLQLETMLENVVLSFTSRYTTIGIILIGIHIVDMWAVKAILVLIIPLFLFNFVLYVLWSIFTLSSVVKENRRVETIAFSEINEHVFNMFLYTLIIGTTLLFRF